MESILSFGVLQPLEALKEKWTQVTINSIKPLPITENGNQGIFVIVDRLSKMLRIIRFNTKRDAPNIAKLFMENFYRHHGLPSVIISDRDHIFMSKFWRSLIKSLETMTAQLSAYHPNTNGQTEILNRKKEKMIWGLANYDESNWDEHLMHFEYRILYLSIQPQPIPRYS